MLVKYSELTEIKLAKNNPIRNIFLLDKATLDTLKYD